MIAWLLALLLVPPVAGFRDDFDAVKVDPAGAWGWRTLTGDGQATIKLRPAGKGVAAIEVDATRDRRGIWWALIERNANLDTSRLEGGHEVTIEGRLRASHAPRRVNLQVLTDKTTDYHSHLMEFDLPDTAWHTVRMTTRGFRAATGDKLIAHLALMDWGLEKYRVEVDYLAMSIVPAAQAPPDLGDPVPYHPPVADPRTFSEEAVALDGTIDLEDADANLNDWSAKDGARRVPLIVADGARIAVLRWDLRRFAGRRLAGAGQLELTTHAVQRKAADVKDFGLLRVVEILTDAAWEPGTLTAERLLRGQPLARALNPQMIIDWPVTEGTGGKTLLTISRPALQRLIDGKSGGIAVKALGSLSAAFVKGEARLRFNLVP